MNPINNHHDDPRLTAYALGELSQGEREQVEALLRDDQSARQIVEEIRATAGLLTNELANQPSDAVLTDAQHQTIASNATTPRRSPRARFITYVASGLAAAAIMAVGFATFTPSLNRAREVAIVQRGREVERFPESQSKLQSQQNPFQISPGKQNGAGATGEKREEKAQFENGFSGVQPRAGDVRVDQLAVAKSGVVDLNDSVLMQAQVDPKVYERMQAEEKRLVVRATKAIGGRAARAPNDSPTGDGLQGGAYLHKEIDGDGDLDTPSVTRRADYHAHNTEAYDRITDNAFLDVAHNPLSTFSIDVDTASYSNIRRFINEQSQLPPRDAVRIEEMINYFPYEYPSPVGDVPFGANIEVAGCPWNSDHRLVRIALKGKEIAKENRPASNLVFLIDVSGSMSDANKLPLLKSSMQRMVRELKESDRVAIVVYAGNSGLVLPSTACDERNQRTILDALERLQAGGSTNGAAGIQLAYQVASENFIKDGTNRVILCTDGDFNVGVTNQGDLTRLIEDKAKTKSNVFLSVLGFGMGNVKDSTMEKLADKGNGNYAYIDNEREANKVLVQQMSGTLITIAKDVKIQVEFNPAKVGTYRLIGYENRMLAKEDFNDDKKDAGEIGAGHTVTALYEIAPVGAKGDAPPVDPLKYGPPATDSTIKTGSDELLTVKLRYKAPDAPIEQGTSKLLEFPVKDSGQIYSSASKDFKFASSVAAFGMVLRESPYKGNATLDGVIELATEGRGEDANGYRGEFIGLVRKAKTLQRR